MDKASKHKASCSCGHLGDVVQHDQKEEISKPVLLALLPCGLRNAFQQALFNAFPEYVDAENSKLVVEGNLNYEKSFFAGIDKLNSVDELPDIFISSDINSLYHKRFQRLFLNSDNFETISTEVHSLFDKSNYVHPNRLMVWFTTNLLVMVVDTDKLGVRMLPQSWLDILPESFSNDLTLRGDTDFFCNAMFFPYMKTIGDEAIRLLGKNTARGLHPSQMVKMLNAGNIDGTTVYVMPYSFALKVRNTERFRIVFPQEGAIVSPVQMLVKKGKYIEHKALIDYILSAEMSNVLLQSGFPSANKDAVNQLQSATLNWVGWEYMEDNDIQECKEKMQKLFFSEFRGESELLVDEKHKV